MLSHETRTERKWPITISRVIEASADDVWGVISTPGILEKCHPFCAQNPVQVWSNANSQDEIHYLNGMVYERRFNQWSEGDGYNLEIAQSGRVLATVLWRISRVGEKSCRLRITIYPNVLLKYPVIVRWLIHSFRLRPMLGNYLESVIRGVDWYVTHGEPVTRNQFGKHPWFSTTDKVFE